MIKDFKQRQAFLKFRISNHRLQIETGCYIKPKIAHEDRICEKCYSSEVEDEQHFFLLNCGFYHNHSPWATASRKKPSDGRGISDYHNHRNTLFEAIKSRICILEILCKSLIKLTCKLENFKLLSSRIYILYI